MTHGEPGDVPEPLILHVRGALSGDPCCAVAACPGWTVRRLKTEIANAQGPKVQRQHLLAGSRALSDGEVLAEALLACDSREVLLLHQEPRPPEIPCGPGRSTPLSLRTGGGFSSICWTVEGRRMRRNQSLVVSPPFELDFGDGLEQVEFRLSLYPRGASSFQRSRGKGSIELKCAQALPEVAGHVSLRFSVGNNAGLGPARGPFAHDLGKSGLCRLPQGQEEFDFGAAVDPHSMELLVCLEMTHAA